MEAVLSTKGELLIPTQLMDRYGLSAGATVVLEPREGEIALRPAGSPSSHAQLVRQDGDVFLQAPTDAPPMTPDNVKRLLQDWP